VHISFPGLVIPAFLEDTMPLINRDRLLGAMDEPAVMIEDGRPVLVARCVLNDDLADELIAQRPESAASIRQGQISMTAKVRVIVEEDSGLDRSRDSTLGLFQ
jgi:hypothetical protein